MREIGPAGTATLEKGLALLARIARDQGQTPVGEIALDLGFAQSTARRLVAALERQGFVARGERGRYIAGERMIALAECSDWQRLLAGASRALLRRLAREVKTTAHLGVLDAGMVMYVVKEQSGSTPMFTREGGQLEAYCSGIGKVLLSHLPNEEREAYLTGAPFVALTEQTITDPALLRAELEKVKEQGYAIDNAEIEEGLYCLAVPVTRPQGEVVAAISISSRQALGDGLGSLIDRLRRSALAIASRLGPSDDNRQFRPASNLSVPSSR